MDKSKVVFHALDRDAEIELSERNLPHWFQVDAAMFITFRTADSLPKEVVLRWHRELQEWLESQHLPATLADSVLTPEANELKSLLGLFTEKQQKEFTATVRRPVPPGRGSHARPALGACQTRPAPSRRCAS